MKIKEGQYYKLPLATISDCPIDEYIKIEGVREDGMLKIVCFNYDGIEVSIQEYYTPVNELKYKVQGKEITKEEYQAAFDQVAKEVIKRIKE